MPNDKRTNLKQILQDECLPALANESKYFNTQAVRTWLIRRKFRCQPATVNRYLHEFTQAGLVFDAGRGWYSSLATPFTLNREPVSSLVQELNKTFPLLEFSCWSTGQVASYGHHLLAKFVAFVHTERDAMPSVFDFLRSARFDAHLNPRGPLADQFEVGERTVVVRPAITTQPVQEHLVQVEGLLVDLFVESQNLRLLDQGEFFQVFSNLTRAGRVSMGGLVEYAGKRKTAAAELLKSINGEFVINSPLIDL